MSKRIITALSAGLALAAVTGCGRGVTDGPTENPPPPIVEPPRNPPPPEVVPALPTWEQVVNPPSDEPAEIQRTNPPSPALRVDPDGTCFVTWHDPRTPAPDAVRAVGTGEDPGTQIQCTEEAQTLLETWTAQQKAPEE